MKSLLRYGIAAVLLAAGLGAGGLWAQGGSGSWIFSVPNCPDTSGNHLNFNNTGNGTASCGDTSSGGGGAPAILVEGGGAAKISAMSASPSTLPGLNPPNVALQVPGDATQNYRTDLSTLLVMPTAASGAGFGVGLVGGTEGTPGYGGGSVGIEGGQSTGGAPGPVVIQGGAQLGAGPTALTTLQGSPNLFAGGAGGGLVVQGGIGGANGNGGLLSLSGGHPNAGGAGTGVAGGVDIVVGNSPVGIHIDGATGNVLIDKQLTVAGAQVLGTAQVTAAAGAATCATPLCTVTSEALVTASTYALTLTDTYISATSVIQVTVWTSVGAAVSQVTVDGVTPGAGSAVINFALLAPLTGTITANISVAN